MKDDKSSKEEKISGACVDCNRNCCNQGIRGKWQYRNHGKAAGGGAVYGLGLIGAVIYFVGQATSFWLGALGILKAIVWPAILVYELLKFLVH